VLSCYAAHASLAAAPKPLRLAATFPAGIGSGSSSGAGSAGAGTASGTSSAVGSRSVSPLPQRSLTTSPGPEEVKTPAGGSAGAGALGAGGEDRKAAPDDRKVGALLLAALHFLRRRTIPRVDVGFLTADCALSTSVRAQKAKKALALMGYVDPAAQAVKRQLSSDAKDDAMGAKSEIGMLRVNYWYVPFLLAQLFGLWFVPSGLSLATWLCRSFRVAI
jgi:hypothetical protein